MFDNDIWYMIPGFNGYEINKFKQIRSFKNYRVFPRGYLIKTYRDRKGKHYIHLTDNNNIRRKMYIDDLWTLVQKDPNKYIRTTSDTYGGSRNKIIGSDKLILVNTIEETKPKEYCEINLYDMMSTFQTINTNIVSPCLDMGGNIVYVTPIVYD